MGGAVPHNSHLNRRGSALKLAFQRAGAVCPWQGSAGRDCQILFKYYTCILSCNPQWERQCKLCFMLHLSSKFRHIFHTSLQTKGR